MDIFFVTGNENKYNEAKGIIPNLKRIDLDLVEIQQIEAKEIIKHKLREAKALAQGCLIVEDVSLSLNCLNGLPGLLIKWFLKTIGNDGLVAIAKNMSNTKAEAKTTIGFVDENGDDVFFEAVTDGVIVSPRGDNGFGWDPIFQPSGNSKTLAELTLDEKNEISTRGEVFRKLKDYLDKK